MKVQERASAGPTGIAAPRDWFRFVLAAGIVSGVGLRVLFLSLPKSGGVDGDEAVAGLMALHALRDGELDAFYWGQNYGGSLEPLLAVPLFAVLGPTTLALKLVPMVLSTIAAALVWRIGRRTVGDRAGAAAAVAMWVWPANMVLWSTKERGFYWVCLVAGLVLFLLVLQLAERPQDTRRWLVLGLAGGIGWWSSPQVLYFAVPGLVLLVASLRSEAWRVVQAAPTAILAASPWLAFNLRNDWLSLRPANHFQDEGLVGNASVLLREGLPVILGFHVGEGWLVQGVLPLLYYVLVAAVVVRVVRRPVGAGPIVVALLTYPVIYAFFPVSGVVGEGRYLLFLLPFLALIIAHAAGSRAVQAGFLIGAVVLSTASVARIEDANANLAVDQLVPADIGPVLQELDRRDVRFVIANYFVASRITFESEEEIIGAALTDSRYEPHARAVAASEAPAWVFVEGTHLIPEFERQLERRGVGFERVATGGFVLYFPSTSVVCPPPVPTSIGCG